VTTPSSRDGLFFAAEGRRLGGPKGWVMRIRWDRLGRWALIGVFALVLYLYIGPLLTWIGTWREAGRQRATVAALKAENARLKAQAKALKAPGALEREARQLGLVKAGERAYVVQNLPR
jgi:Septum formation initiator